ncbi:MAG: penicillin-binding transpeptidase domain-containing protein [Actinomycetota bacterium]
MTFRFHGPLGTVASCCATALLVAGCTPAADEPDLPSAQPPAEAFVEAWNDRDTDAMAEMLVEPVEGFKRFFREALHGPVEFEVTLGEVEEGETEDHAGGASPPPPSATAGYEIVYSVGGSEGELPLAGALEMTYARGDWKVAWERDAMWPGFERATGIELSYRRPRRAPILDRRGRVLARGGAGHRTYPFGSSAGSTVGHVGALTRAQAAGSDLYRAGDLAGASGLEAAFDERLAGDSGLRLDVVRGSRSLHTLVRRRPDPGRAVKTTLDMRVQAAAAAAYGATTGGAVVLDPSTGDLLAVVSSAELDPADYVGARGVRPFNRALSGLYPPGSSLKVMTGAAALEAGVVRPGTRLTGPAEYKGVRNFESGEFGALDFATAVKFSVNTAFAQIAEDLGGKRLTRYARAFGFNRPPEMALGAATSSFPRPEDEGDVMWGSIGQAQVLATPLQMATVAATIANGGRRMEPRVSMHVRPSAGRVVSRKTAATMTRLMEDVVEGGTGTAARIPGVRVAGKTGTAEVDVAGKRLNHAWFVAFAPADDPKLAVAVVAELGGIGGRVAAPLARAILQATLPLAP